MNINLFSIRCELRLSTTEAAQFVHVTRRTWELWESGKQIMPQAKQELFNMKLNKIRNGNNRDSELVVIISKDGHHKSVVVSSDNFVMYEEINNDESVIKYLAVDRQTNELYAHSIKFIKYPHNKHVIEAIQNWTPILE